MAPLECSTYMRESASQHDSKKESMKLSQLPTDTEAIVIHVNLQKIQGLTHRKRTDLMGRLEVFLETELPAAVGEDVVHSWDTVGFELPNASSTPCCDPTSIPDWQKPGADPRWFRRDENADPR